MTIPAFKRQYSFLSNFHVSMMTINGREYRTNEHWFQANKATNMRDHDRIRSLFLPGEAKREAGKIVRRPDWEKPFDHPYAQNYKEYIMWTGLVVKFNIPLLRDALLATHPHILIEGNTWGDRYWGQVHGDGENRLGYLLMELRKDLINGN